MHQRSCTWPQRPERPDGSESQSVRNGVSSEEHGAIARCDEREGAAGGEEETTKPGGVRETGTGRETQGLGASGAEWRSTGRPGGADGDEAERALCPVTRNQPPPGAAPTRWGAKPLL